MDEYEVPFMEGFLSARLHGKLLAPSGSFTSQNLSQKQALLPPVLGYGAGTRVQGEEVPGQGHTAGRWRSPSQPHCPRVTPESLQTEQPQGFLTILTVLGFMHTSLFVALSFFFF